MVQERTHTRYSTLHFQTKGSLKYDYVRFVGKILVTGFGKCHGASIVDDLNAMSDIERCWPDISISKMLFAQLFGFSTDSNLSNNSPVVFNMQSEKRDRVIPDEVVPL